MSPIEMTKGQQDQTKAIVVGQVEPFDLVVEHNQLLVKHGVFGNEAGLTAGHICQGGSN